MGAWVTLLVPTVTFKPLKLVLKFHNYVDSSYFFLFRVISHYGVMAL